MEYPSDASRSTSPETTPQPSLDVCEKDFFKDIAQYDKYYQDEKLLWQTDRWDADILEELKEKAEQKKELHMSEEEDVMSEGKLLLKIKKPILIQPTKGLRFSTL